MKDAAKLCAHNYPVGSDECLDCLLEDLARFRAALVKIGMREASSGFFCNFCTAEEIALDALRAGEAS